MMPKAVAYCLGHEAPPCLGLRGAQVKLIKPDNPFFLQKRTEDERRKEGQISAYTLTRYKSKKVHWILSSMGTRHGHSYMIEVCVLHSGATMVSERTGFDQLEFTNVIWFSLILMTYFISLLHVVCMQCWAIYNYILNIFDVEE